MDLYSGPTPECLAVIPAELKTVDQWLLWKGEARTDPHTGLPKITKRPINAQSLQYASTTDPTTWQSFHACVTALPVALEEWERDNPAQYRGGGLGFVFSHLDFFFGIDLDHCIDPQSGIIEPWARQIVADMDSYTEYSPSVQGLHILGKGVLPPGHNRKNRLEMYDTERFFTITGAHLPGTPATLESRQGPLSALWCANFGATIGQYVWCVDDHGVITNPIPWRIQRIAPHADATPFAFFQEMRGGWPLAQCEITRDPGQPSSVTPMPDHMILGRVFSAANGAKTLALWQGDTSEYPSASEADFGLCCRLIFWTQDPAQIDRLFRQSALMRPKWDEVHGSQTVGTRTIGRALAMQTTHYSAPASLQVSARNPPEPMGGGHEPPASPGTPFNFDNAVSHHELLKLMRVPPRFLIDQLVPDGLTILAAPAKSYKSYFSLSLALATVGAGDWCDAFPVEETGNVVFFGLEAPLMQLRNRMFQLRPDYNPDAMPHDLIFFSGMQCLPTFKNGLQVAIEMVIGRYTPRLIVIDPLSYLYRLGRQDDLASATLDLLWPLAEMASQAHVAIFAPEHMRKRSKEDVSVVDQLAGSHIKAAVVHGLLMLHREGEDIIVETTMRDARSQELALSLEFDPGQHQVIWGYKGANVTLGQSRVEAMKTKALAELHEKRYPMKVADLIANCGFPNTTQTKDNLRQILHRAEGQGEIAQSKRGEYYWIGQN